MKTDDIIDSCCLFDGYKTGICLTCGDKCDFYFCSNACRNIFYVEKNLMEEWEKKDLKKHNEEDFYYGCIR